MNRIVKRLTGACTAAAILLMAAACTEGDDRNANAPQDGGGEPVAVDFTIPDLLGVGSGGDAQTRAASALPEGATVRILAAVVGEFSLSGNQAYYVKGGRLVPCTVDDNGKFIAEDPNGKMALKPNNYDFCVCTPALKMTLDTYGDPCITVLQNMDYAASITQERTIAFTGAVTLDPLNHECARLQLVMNSDDAAITAMTVKSATLTGFSDDKLETMLGGPLYLPIGSGTKSATTTAFVRDAANPKLSTADLFLLPCSIAAPVKATYEIAYTVMGIERTETVSADLPKLILTKGKSYTLTANFTKDGGIHLSISDWDQSGQDNVLGTGTYPYVQSGNVIVSKDLYGSSGGIFHKSWSTTPAHSDYSGYLLSVSPRFTVAQNDVGAMKWPATLTACPSGWRIPTGGELQLIYNLKTQLTTAALTAVNYWSAASDGLYTDCAICLRTDGTLAEFNQNTHSDYRLRCVQDAYPYVTKNAAGSQCIIVSQDQNGSSGAALHPNWTTTPAHNETSADNALAAMFELLYDDYSGRNWYIASGIYHATLNPGTQKTCPDGWRLPTYKEIDLIYRSKGQLTGVDSFRDSNYWSSTEYSADNTSAYMINLSNYSAYGARSKDRTDMRVRCVRDL